MQIYSCTNTALQASAAWVLAYYFERCCEEMIVETEAEASFLPSSHQVHTNGKLCVVRFSLA